METLKNAIYTKYLGNADLVAALTNGLHFNTAPPNTDMPYATYFIVSDIPGRTFTEKMENCIIQFNLFSDTSDDAEVEDIYRKLIACFDDCASAMPVFGYYSIYVDRTFSRLLFDERNNSWQHVTTYQVELQLSKIVDCDNQYYAEAADNTVHNMVGNHISLSAWVKVRSGGVIPTNFITKGHSAEGYMLGVNILEGYPWFFMAQFGPKSAVYYSDIRDDKWHHVAGTYDKDTYVLTIYVDGDSEVGPGPTQALETPNIWKFRLGYDAGGYPILPGYITDVKVYLSGDGHWSDDEVAYQVAHPYDYSAQAGTITEYWRCTEGSGLILYGSDGNDLTLTSENVWVDYSL